MTEEGAEQRLVPLQGAGGSTGNGGQLLDFEGGAIGQRVHFQIAPRRLDRIELRCVGRQEEIMQVMSAGDELRSAFGAMGIEAIPDQYARPLQFLVQMAEEGDNLRAANVRLGMQAKLKACATAAGRHRRGGYGRCL